LGSGFLKNKCSDKNTFFNIKSSISAQKLPLNVHSNFKYENFTKISKTSGVPDPKLIILILDPDPLIENQEFQIWIRILL